MNSEDDSRQINDLRSVDQTRTTASVGRSRSLEKPGNTRFWASFSPLVQWILGLVLWTDRPRRVDSGASERLQTGASDAGRQPNELFFTRPSPKSLEFRTFGHSGPVGAI